MTETIKERALKAAERFVINRGNYILGDMDVLGINCIVYADNPYDYYICSVNVSQDSMPQENAMSRSWYETAAMMAMCNDFIEEEGHCHFSDISLFHKKESDKALLRMHEDIVFSD